MITYTLKYSMVEPKRSRRIETRTKGKRAMKRYLREASAWMRDKVQLDLERILYTGK